VRRYVVKNLILPTVVADKGDAKLVNKSERAFKIRSAQPEDEESIRSLLSEFKLPLEGLENTKMWVLEGNNGNVVGTAGLEVWGKTGLLRSVAISKILHNRGYGTSLVRHVVNEARKCDISELFLLTETAQAFFQRFGFGKSDRACVSGSIANSAEFKGACPKTAVLMSLNIE